MQKILDGLAELWTRTEPPYREPYNSTQRWVLLIVFVAAVVVRFWGLGAVGLHGDEETMALAVNGILKDGVPYLPSGMLYPRGLAQLYLMAGSVSLFGETEWALRLPSALCGIAAVGFAFLAGRRFLQPQWNLAFTAAVALLPQFIVYSQTARMYVFLVTCVAALMWLTFEWERTGKLGFLVCAVGVTLLGIHFHSLMVLSAAILLFPPLIRDDGRELRQAAIAIAAIAVGFFFLDGWIEHQYGDLPSIDEAAATPRPWYDALDAVFPRGLIQIVLAVAVVLVLAGAVARKLPPQPVRWICAILLVAALTAQLFLFYCLALILLVAGIVVALRHGRNLAAPIALLVTAVGGLGFAHMIALYRGGVTSLHHIAAAMMGRPSIWPYLRTGDFSEVALALATLGFLFALWRLAHRRRVADYWVLFVLGSLIPLLLIGVMRWNVPVRYTAGAVLPYLLCAFAVLQNFTAWLLARIESLPGRGVPLTAAVVGSAFVINPIAMACTVNSGYATHPDHKGAAEFMRTLHLGPKDVVLAEDVLQQTYYLGAVNYWLIGWSTARHYVRELDGQPLDIYTATPVLKSAAEVEAVVKKTRGNVYIIGSGENQSDGRRLMRSGGIYELLKSDRVVRLYDGRDGLTHVWKVPAPPARVAGGEKAP